jgi:hypothetical protein
VSQRKKNVLFLVGLLFLNFPTFAQESPVKTSDSIPFHNDLDQVKNFLKSNRINVDSLLNHVNLNIDEADSTLQELNKKEGFRIDSLQKEVVDSTGFSKVKKTLKDLVERLKININPAKKIRRSLPAEIIRNDHLNYVDQISSYQVKFPDIFDVQQPVNPKTLSLSDKVDLSSFEKQLESFGPEDYQKYFEDFENLENLQLKEADIEKYLKDEIEELSALDNFNSNTELHSLQSEFNSYHEQLGSIARKITQIEDMKEEVKEKAIETVTEFLQQHKDKITDAQQSLRELKKKYSYVPSTLEMDSAKRRNSLEDESLGQRLIYGGQFQFLKGKPISLDLSPCRR